jgi:RNA polymerase sigma-70 factor (ECF subfamily)
MKLSALFARRNGAAGDEGLDLDRLENRDAYALVAEARRGDETAFTSLYLRYFESVYAYMRMALNDADEAEGAAKQVFVKALRGQAGFPADRSFKTWLFTIARADVIGRLRQHARVADESPAPSAFRQSRSSDFTPATRALGWSSDEDLMLLVDCLPEVQRQAIVLRHVLDFEEREIANVLRRSEEAVSRLQDRAMDFLNSRLASLGREPSADERRRMVRFRPPAGPLRPAHSVTLLR